MRRRDLLVGSLAAALLAACRRYPPFARAAGAASGDAAEPDRTTCAIALARESRVDWAAHFEPGIYRCAVCGQALFESATKYDPGTPWPSFWAPIEGAIAPAYDRQEGRFSESAIVCSRCGAPLGDVLRDGPPPTGLRYCIVSAALTFEPAP